MYYINHSSLWMDLKMTAAALHKMWIHNRYWFLQDVSRCNIIEFATRPTWSQDSIRRVLPGCKVANVVRQFRCLEGVLAWAHRRRTKASHFL
jgi:hypothetical protein